MTVYDFDKTIYERDSSIDFYIYALRKHPALLIYLPRQMKGFFLFFLKKIGKTELKEHYFSFLRGINTAETVKGFWQEKRKYIRLRPGEGDLVISASPEFLLKPICDGFGSRLIASEVDPKDGTFASPNCYGEEKLKRYKDAFGDKPIEHLYTDSYSDKPLMSISDKVFLIDRSGRIKSR